MLIKKYIGKIEPNEKVMVENGKVYLITEMTKREWASDICSNYGSNYNYAIDGILRAVIVRKLWGNRVGYAFCSPSDVFDPMIGKAIAICRAERLPIPNEIFW